MLSYQQMEKNSTEWSHSYGDQTPCVNSFFGGGSAYDICPLFGIRHTSFIRCIWAIIHAINETPDMRIDFPMEHFKQQQIAHGFMKKALLSLIVVLVALTVCWYGLRNQLNTIVQS